MPTPVQLSDLWDLQASAADLVTLAGVWRSLGTAATTARDAVSPSARALIDDEHWTGDAADAYDTQQAKVCADLGEAGGWGTTVADALDTLAWTVAAGQNTLSEQFMVLTATVATTRAADGTLTFQPADDAQVALVSDAIAAANETRTAVDEAQASAQRTLDGLREDIDAVQQKWRERSVRLVDLNIGSGHDNGWPLGDKLGVGPEEVGDLARLLARERPDVVTLQEVFHRDLDNLRDELEERTGDTWHYEFVEASEKWRVTSPMDVVGFLAGGGVGYNDGFGNAVFVRESDDISGLERVDDFQLPPGEEGRAALHTRVVFRDP